MVKISCKKQYDVAKYMLISLVSSNLSIIYLPYLPVIMRISVFFIWVLVLMLMLPGLSSCQRKSLANSNYMVKPVNHHRYYSPKMDRRLPRTKIVKIKNWQARSYIPQIMPPNISVILPVYNGEGTIRKAIESILQQTCSDFELLLINDGSTDHTLEVVAGLSGQGGLPDPRISIYDRPHRGLASALNYGIRQASGTYIARMDADDYAYPNRFALQLCYLEQNPDIDICATQVIFEGDPENEGLIQYVTWQNRLTSHRQMYLNRFVDSPVIHPTLIIRKSVFTAHGFYPEKKGPEDFRLWLQWMAQGVRFGKVEMKLFK